MNQIPGIIIATVLSKMVFRTKAVEYFCFIVGRENGGIEFGV